jgi:hypothetical protein
VDKKFGQIHDFAVNQYKTMVASAQEIPRQTTDMIKDVGQNTAKFTMELLAKSKKFGTDPGLYKMGTDFFSSPPSNVMRRLPGYSIGISAFGGSMIDSTQFAWRFGRRLVLELLGVNVDRSFTPVLWQTLADSMDDFRTYLVKPGFRACAGLGVMLGYSNPWARVFRESCNSAVATQATAVETVKVLFVYVPTLACICRDTQGRNFAEYAQENCWEPAPTFMKTLVSDLIKTTGTTSQSDACEKFLSQTEDELRGIMDPVMQFAYAATEAVGSSLDYLTAMIDPEAGSCSNLISSPYTMAIVPEPIDYFRACGKTNTCRSKCSTVFEEFDAINERLAASTNTFDFSGSVEKRFFSSKDVSSGKAATPFEILAMMEVPASDNITVLEFPEPCCGSSDVRDRCVLVCGFNKDIDLEVIEYCVPYNIGVGTHERARWAVEVVDAINVRSVHFGTRTELVVATEGTVYLYSWHSSRQTLMVPLAATAVSTNSASMHRIAWVFVSPGNYGIIHGFINNPESMEGLSRRVSVCIDLSDGPRHFRTKERLCKTNLNNHLDNHVPTCVGPDGDNLILLPTKPDQSVRYCTRESRGLYDYTCVDSAPTPQLARDLGFGDSVSATFVVTAGLQAVRRTPKMSANTLVLGNASLSLPTRIFNSNPTSISSTWLQEVRLLWDMKESSEIIEAFKTGSQSIESSISINQRCSVEDCSGCSMPSVQRACFSVQQCAVAKCIGTVVNLERPLCSVGRLLQAGLDVDLVKIHGKDRFTVYS